MFCISRRTLQYYDDIGLLTAVRSPENYRIYGREELERLRQIMQYRDAGFKLDEIRGLLECSGDVKVQILDARIAELQKARLRVEEQLRVVEELKKGTLQIILAVT